MWWGGGEWGRIDQKEAAAYIATHRHCYSPLFSYYYHCHYYCYPVVVFVAALIGVKPNKETVFLLVDYIFISTPPTISFKSRLSPARPTTPWHALFSLSSRKTRLPETTHMTHADSFSRFLFDGSLNTVRSQLSRIHVRVHACRIVILYIIPARRSSNLMPRRHTPTPVIRVLRIMMIYI